MHPKDLPSDEEELKRYQLHENDSFDKGYQAFIRPLINAIDSSFPNNSKGLDYGSGPGTLTGDLLTQKGFCIKKYDPFFADKSENLQAEYDFIICCEVMEHFHRPQKEFKKLYRLLVDKGKLFCKTSLITPAIIQKFQRWRYKDDPTHVFFYSKESLNWIKKQIGYSKLEICSEHFTFTK